LKLFPRDDNLVVIVSNEHVARLLCIGNLCQIGRGGVFFFPQANYVTEGSLRANVIYPLHQSDVPNQELHVIFQVVGLDYLVDRWGLDTVKDWAVRW
jgi:ABC-type uncharacterized transport system fused permease/ATPase subunit